jgi:hypothetical protein
MLGQSEGTHVVVQVIIEWDAATRTAIFIWRGSITQQDWLQDTKLVLVNGSWLLSPAIAGIFPYVETHKGFTGTLPTPDFGMPTGL